MRSFGRLHAVGVEGTGSNGAGLSRHLRDHGVRVVEVNRPDPASAATRASPIRWTPTPPPTRCWPAAPAHCPRAWTRTACINELRSLLITAPARLREQLAGRSALALTGACARLRPGSDLADPLHGTKLAVRSLACRYRALTHEITDLDAHLQDLIAQARPDLLTIVGVGPETAAQLLITCDDNPDRLTSADAFATLCGAAPVPAPSGKTNRHRLSRGGDREANRALYLIVLSRMGLEPRAPRPTSPAAPPKARPRKESSAASSATPPVNSSKPSRPTRQPQARPATG